MSLPLLRTRVRAWLVRTLPGLPCDLIGGGAAPGGPNPEPYTPPSLAGADQLLQDSPRLQSKPREH
jgi:hypothetical protein